MTANEARELNKDLKDLLISGVVDLHVLQAACKGKTELVVGFDEFPGNITKDMVLNWIHANGFTGSTVCDILPDPNFRGLLYSKFKGYIIRW